MYHVLIIEDDAMIAMSIEGALEEAGASTFAFAHSQQEALRSVRKQRPDLITSDVALTQGTGPDAIREIHEQFGAIPVIFVTGTPEICKGGDPLVKIVPKPFSGQRLRNVFLGLVGSSRESDR